MTQAQFYKLKSGDRVQFHSHSSVYEIVGPKKHQGRRAYDIKRVIESADDGTDIPRCMSCIHPGNWESPRA